eukprot:m.66611 g.66611  ORF g.66611 m.66611 type:complete len:310 (-) comp8371_c0_seq2:713-1642(-)
MPLTPLWLLRKPLRMFPNTPMSRSLWALVPLVATRHSIRDTISVILPSTTGGMINSTSCPMAPLLRRHPMHPLLPWRRRQRHHHHHHPPPWHRVLQGKRQRTWKRMRNACCGVSHTAQRSTHVLPILYSCNTSLFVVIALVKYVTQPPTSMEGFDRIYRPVSVLVQSHVPSAHTRSTCFRCTCTSTSTASMCHQRRDTFESGFENGKIGQNLLCRVGSVHAQGPVVDRCSVPSTIEQIVAPDHGGRSIASPCAPSLSNRCVLATLTLFGGGVVDAKPNCAGVCLSRRLKVKVRQPGRHGSHVVIRRIGR